MREFICIDITDFSCFEELCSSRLFRDACIRAVQAAGLHFTLHFLGEVNEEMNTEISRLLEDVVSRHRRFSVAFGGTGAFPTVQRPEVIWAGITAGEELGIIHREIGKGLEKLGIPIENRIYKPHVTLARLRCRPDAASLEDFFSTWGDRRIGEQEIRSIKLKQSVLSQTGALHRTIHDAHLRQ